MQSMQEDIVKPIFSAIDELNLQLSGGQRLEKSIDTPLFGESGPLDSLGLVNLIVLVEQKVEEQTGQAVSLATDEALSLKDSPFQSVRRLAEYVSSLLESKTHE
jgi:acyl carrier protein